MNETPTTTLIGPAPRIAVEWQGEGPLVVFLHGIGGNRSNWREQIAAFSAHFTAAAWDARGYGDSDDYDGPLSFADFSSDLLRVLDHFGVQRAHLVGLSMGGRIALDFYGRHAARVASLVLADTSVARRGPVNETQVEEFLRARRRPLLEGKTTADIAPDVARTLVSPSVAPDRFERLVASLSALRKEPYLKTLETVTRYSGFPQFNTVHVPCLVLTGEQDTVAPPSLVRAMADVIPGARYVELPGTGHMSNIENPDGFNAAVLPFLLDHRGR